jgi:spore germination protein KA
MNNDLINHFIIRLMSFKSWSVYKMNRGWDRLKKTRIKGKKEFVYEEPENKFLASQGFSLLLDENLQKLKDDLGNSSDLIVREFKMGTPMYHKVAAVYINGLTDKRILGSLIIERLMDEAKGMHAGETWLPEQLVQYITQHILTISFVEKITDRKKMFSLLLSGMTLVLVDGWDQALACSAQGGELRSISEPLTEPSVRGPKESFTEALITNTSMIRRRIKSPNLWLETIQLGKITQTEIGIMYMNGIVNDKLLTEVKERLNKIEADEIFGSNTIEEWIMDDLATHGRLFSLLNVRMSLLEIY